ncbi:hypothetical protein Mkiyose1665_52370 [Mycobacterium kiyosense]|uniref:CsbD-like domain-containing protein n=1 Tax=Mycobacterium kiyosense TaxID=2871094 RepID=A0A9P3V1S2_9MYCO|nr:hypothetical protein IWGMT90018_60100 [Mycobacterium kiyosense]BDE11187.1 hypothetical protein MKCMC460_00470 [Mycobacterium sp. 20KCMC460]GLB85521.1 hypothetical protein SRL2020028_47770 [Mycobacterium kiyosense]GLB92180.1 hypothetical protein SRL2020130_49970 [Mycobacterium kiyosense]GLB98440.1 hypothetical protein SRL2020226_52160 [Mycobacterium kiyosense]
MQQNMAANRAGNRLSNTAQYWGGRAKETVGRLTGDRRTEYEGRLDQVKANVKDAGNRVAHSFRRRRRSF